MSLKLDLNDGSNVTQALQVFQSALLLACTDTTQAVAIQESLSEVKWQGIWGRKVPLSHVLKDGDRLEIYRPLRVDPKLARKQRFKGQGKGRTGLFARRRVGGVAGY
jgi:putative ubiquitin-RnfH superfamily antitoxin RatB of RatAB toxin-antitoxin module